MAQARPLLGVPYIVANIRRSLNMNEIYRVRCVQIEFHIVKTLKQRAWRVCLKEDPVRSLNVSTGRLQ